MSSDSYILRDFFVVSFANITCALKGTIEFQALSVPTVPPTVSSVRSFPTAVVRMRRSEPHGGQTDSVIGVVERAITMMTPQCYLPANATQLP